jgi:trigger factor
MDQASRRSQPMRPEGTMAVRPPRDGQGSMQVTEIAADGLKREFKITIPAKDFEKRIESELEEYGRSVRLPGFRPGKVPMPVLKQRFGSSVRGRVMQNAVNDTTFQVINERGLRAAGQPRIEITKGAEGEDVEYSLAIELMPDIRPMDFKTLELERLVVEISDKEVNEYQIVGHLPGESFTIDVTFPEGYPHPEVAGKAARFAVTIKELREPQAVAVDDELAKSVGLESLDALKQQVKERLERDYGALARGRLKRQLLDRLAESHDFNLPPGLVNSEFDAIWQQIVADRQAGRLDPEDAGKDEEQLKKEYREIAERRVKLGLLLSEVGRLHNIEVSNDEIGRAVMAEASRYPGNERKVVEYYQRSPEALAQLRAPLYEEKVVDFILGQAKISERKAPVSELTGDGKDETAKA